MENKKICFLGAGNIAEAIISGIINSDKSIRKNIIATDIRKERLTYISNKFGIKVTTDNINAVRESDIIVIAVKPQQIKNLLEEISGKIKSSQLVISVAAGITTKYIESFLGKVPVIRTMPNTPVLVQEGMIAYCKGKYAKKEHENLVKELFESVGKVIHLDEKLFNAVTAVSGSGPAYIFYFAESLIKSAEKLGIERKTAKILTIQTISGASKLMKNSDDEPEILRAKVTSPGGTTEQAINTFEKNKLHKIIEKAVISACKRAKQLSK